MASISIKGINKAELFAALYNSSRPLGLGFLHYTPEDMTVKEAENYIKGEDGDDVGTAELTGRNLYFDYVKGRVMKVDLEGDELRTDLYNRDNGEGAAEDIVEKLRK